MNIDAAKANKANWDVWAASHGQDGDHYDVEALVAGADSLTDVEVAGLERAVGDVRGLDVLHVQCHIGLGSISLARRGARVTGADFSPVALAKGRELAHRCGVEVSFVESDSTALPSSLHGRFDLAYSTIGILCWIEDVDAWMRSVAATLRPGGRLLLIDGHPLAQMAESFDPLVLDWSYSFDGPHVATSEGSYAGSTEPTTNVQFSHSLGEVVTAAVDAGLSVVRLEEHLSSPVDMFRQGGKGPDGRYRFVRDGCELPVLFTLIASRP